MKRLAAVVASVALLGAGATTATQAATAAPAQPAGHRAPASKAYDPPPLRWGTCADDGLTKSGVECAMLTVPLDYDKPDGRTIKLAVSRLKHKTAKYQGVMLVNPGGPGGSGLIYSILGRGDFFPGNADSQYDWIGFDPRGVGDSKPALSCDGQYNGYDRPNYVPTTRKLEKEWLRRSEGYATDCKYGTGARLLDHVKTTDNVNDMESLRKALGESQINYYGFSYGTYLGQVYATLHPDRVRRFVWDGVVDPRRVWYQANLDQDVAFQKTIEVYFGYLAKHDDVFHLGTNADSVERNYYRELDKLDAEPAGGVIGPDELTDVMLSAGYYVYDWVAIGKAYAALVNDDDPSGIKEMYDAANPQTEGSDNGYAMYLATSCTDAQWPQSWRRIRNDNWRTYAKAPFETWGNAWFNGPCSFWPGEAAQQPVKIKDTGVSSKMLLVSETLDAATPYSGALEVRKRFKTASLIEGVGGTTHAGSLDQECTVAAVAQYLKDGTVPARKAGDGSDLQCAPVPQPDPNESEAQTFRAGPRDSMQQRVRDALADAQVR